MIVALLILRLILMGEIYFFDLKGYDVYLLPYGSVLSGAIYHCYRYLFGYKFFFTLYDEEKIVYCNLLLKKSSSIDFSEIAFARFRPQRHSALPQPLSRRKGQAGSVYPVFSLWHHSGHRSTLSSKR